MIEKSNDNQFTLDQLFTEEFLHSYNLYGTKDRKKLSDLLPYKAVYFRKFQILRFLKVILANQRKFLDLKKEHGLSLKEIEMDATKQLRRMKKRLYARQKRNR